MVGSMTRRSSSQQDVPPVTVHPHAEADPLAVGLVQLAPVLGDVAANASRHAAICADLAVRGVDLIVFPELSLTGYFLKDLVGEVALTTESDVFAPIQARLGSSTAIMGGVYEDAGSALYNAAFAVTSTAVRLLHAKVYLPTYGLFDEGRYFAAGKTFHLSRTDVPGWNVGTLICEDLWHLDSVGTLSNHGADLLVCLSASPARGVGNPDGLGTERSYDAITRTYALLSTSYLLYCNRVGYEDGCAFWGGSRVVGPDGRYCGEVGGRDEQIDIYGISRRAIRRNRLATPLGRASAVGDPVENAR